MRKRDANSDRFQIPVMFAFRDAFDAGDARKRIEERKGGEKVISGRGSLKRRGADETLLKRNLAVDLLSLVNTIDLASAIDLSDFEHVGRSVLNFGLYDVAHLTSEEMGVDAIARDLSAALIQHEPRLNSDTLQGRARQGFRRGQPAHPLHGFGRDVVQAARRADRLRRRDRHRLGQGAADAASGPDMNREFLELYDRELKILYERAKDFGEEYAGVGERLGGLTEEKMDPGLVGLLEGAAFMAARVQLKLKSEFSEFTTALLDQLVPNYLAPIPSAVLVQAAPAFDDPNLVAGTRYPAGAYMDAVYVEQETARAVPLPAGAASLALWPLSLEKAEYYSGPAPLQALGLEVAAGNRRWLAAFLPPPHDQARRRQGGQAAARRAGRRRSRSTNCRSISSARPAMRSPLYEQLFANCRRIVLRYLDSFGDAKFRPVPLSALEQIGFGQDERLFGSDDRVFAGFELLREFFAFPQKFTGFRLTGLRQVLAGLEAHSFDVLFEFDQPLHRLASVVKPSMFALYAVPAANLFEMSCSRIPITRNEYEHHVVPDRSRWLDFEAHRIVDVFAHYPGNKEKVRVFPLYSLPTGNMRDLRRALLHRAPAAAARDRPRSAASEPRAPTPGPSCSCRSANPQTSTKRRGCASSACGCLPPTGT